jgi:hypothetical protein
MFTTKLTKSSKKRKKSGSSEQWVGGFGLRNAREKSFGAPEAQISPRLPKFEPLPKRFFSRNNSKTPT